jgi:16S rRNA (cytidine1402-2'-O)-methyltransferase
VKGEIVVLVDRGEEQITDEETVDEAMRKALMQMSVKDAAQAVAEAYGLQKRAAYQLALKIGGEE